jgi:hypothetical protein
MSATTRAVWHWMPRAIGVLYAAFISIFALDAWGTGAGFWEELAGFLIHLIPTFLVIIALVIAWKWPRVGGFLFMGLAVAFTLFFGWREIEILLLLALPLAIIGVLFLADEWANRVQLRPRT